MGASLSVEEKIYKSAKENDFLQLQSILQQLHGQGAPVGQYIEYQDGAGNTPLMVSAARGNWNSVNLLLQYGAKPNHFSNLPDGSTALHEAAARGHVQIAEALLARGANPFIENARGLTCVDIAINRGNVGMVRCLELRSHFTGSLQMKVPKFLGLGSEWKVRWVVVMPRFKYPQFVSKAEDRVARSLLVCYKAVDQCLPCCKVWLDGATAQSVVGSQGTKLLQCALALHKNHAMPSGAFMTGEASNGYTMHLRPPDGTAQGTYALQRFMQIVNGSRLPAAQPRPGPRPSAASASQAGVHVGARPGSTANARAGRHQQTKSDEDIARELQLKYNSENAEYLRLHPEAAQAWKVAKEQPGPLQASSTAGSLGTRPSAPMYPDINYSSGTQQPPNTSNRISQPGTSQVGSPEWCAASVPPATTPPPTQAHRPSAEDLADDEAGSCVICMEAPATAGFMHGDSVHKCCCRQCAQNCKDTKVANCPMCRMPIDHVILGVY